MRILDVMHDGVRYLILHADAKSDLPEVTFNEEPTVIVVPNIMSANEVQSFYNLDTWGKSYQRRYISTSNNVEYQIHICGTEFNMATIESLL